MKIIIATVLISLSLIGCSHVQTLSKLELERNTSHWKEPKVAIWYYMGSDSEFHYFHFMDIDKSQNFRIKKSELEIEPQFLLTKSFKKWRVMPWGPHSPR
jgi:hypothetical protein